jgi:hypothetical protein
MTSPCVSLKLEVSFPNSDGSPPRKFSVDRRLKARWNDDPNVVTQQIYDEMKNYRGDFIGDLIQSMSMIVSSELDITSEEAQRDIEVCQWISSLIESMIYTGIREGIHKDLFEATEVIQWDGDVLKMNPIVCEEMRSVNVEKVLLLLAPKLKQLLYLISKDIKQS